MKRFTITKDNRAEVIPRIGEYIRTLKCDEPQSIIVKPYKKNRSLEQNALLWEWYGIIGNELGYSKDEIHDLMRYKHLGMRSREIAGNRIEYLPSTTKLKVGEMAEYLTAIDRWAANLGIRLPAAE